MSCLLAAVSGENLMQMLHMLQTRFAQDERVYKAFLEILNMYRKGQKTISNVYDEVCFGTLESNHSLVLVN
jgi:paired amphipathic helix protein Sin3a